MNVLNSRFKNGTLHTTGWHHSDHVQLLCVAGMVYVTLNIFKIILLLACIKMLTTFKILFSSVTSEFEEVVLSTHHPHNVMALRA